MVSPGQADRRAVGRRRGRLPGRQLPAAVDRVERQVPRHRAGLLARPPATCREFASRLTGSSDLYATSGRRPVASINFVTCHDGFTLHDLVSYNDKHNEANGEGNRDGTDDNRSWNCGPKARPATRRSSRCGTGRSGTSWPRCSCSQGVPMLLGRRRDGPDPGRQQQRLLPGQRGVLAGLVPGRRRARTCSHFTAHAGRAAPGASGVPAPPVLPRPSAEPADSDRRHRLAHPAGQRDDRARTGTPDYAKSLAVFLNGDAISEPDPRGERIIDASSCCCSTRTATPSRSRCPRPAMGPTGRSTLTPAGPGSRSDVRLRLAGRASPAQGGQPVRWSCCAPQRSARSPDGADHAGTLP